MKSVNVWQLQRCSGHCVISKALWIQTLYKQYYNCSLYITPLQSRNVVSAYLSSEQVLPLALHDSIATLKDSRTCGCTNLLSQKAVAVYLKCKQLTTSWFSTRT